MYRVVIRPLVRLLENLIKLLPVWAVEARFFDVKIFLEILSQLVYNYDGTPPPLLIIAEVTVVLLEKDAYERGALCADYYSVTYSKTRFPTHRGPVAAQRIE